ncbi:hypothetical protein LCGC14_1647370 [marine sediment metagenome]|uniref:Uncharacterized protein n=1 Tax=marine sediment metagenome TaxID=412755 RepID=A0A0F9HXS2_9ZZZZ
MTKIDNSVDAIRAIYILLLKNPSEVIKCSIEGNTVTIDIALFEDPKKTDLSCHNYQSYGLQLSPEDNGLSWVLGHWF